METVFKAREFTTQATEGDIQAFKSDIKDKKEKAKTISSIAYVFLDFDRTLWHFDGKSLSWKTKEIYGRTTNISRHEKMVAMAALFEGESMQCLDRFIELLDRKVKIIVTSSWRYQTTVKKLKEIIKEGLKNIREYGRKLTLQNPFSDYIVGKLESDDTLSHGDFRDQDSSSGRRSELIHAYLKDHPEIINYVIFDDFKLDEAFGDRFIQIQGGGCLSESHIRKAIKILAPAKYTKDMEILPKSDKQEETGCSCVIL